MSIVKKPNTGRTGKRKKARKSSKPKKPLSAYIYFSQEEREVIKRENPHMCVSEIMKQVSMRWANMLKIDKKPYEIQASHDKIRYENDLAMFRAKKRNSVNKRQKLE